LGYQIWLILRILSGQQRSLDLKPLGIASEYNKRIRAMGPFANCHGILIILNHVTWTFCEKRWQNNPLSDGSNIIVTYNDGNSTIITYNDGVLKTLIEIYTKLFLI
jgi:hypothetical protein